MRYIIDTNILLFYISEKDRLSKEVSDLLWDSSNMTMLLWHML